MIVTLDERELIERVPGQPRSITLLVPPDALPLRAALDALDAQISKIHEEATLAA